jgi:hypothetical protein
MTSKQVASEQILAGKSLNGNCGRRLFNDSATLAVAKTGGATPSQYRGMVTKL